MWQGLAIDLVMATDTPPDQGKHEVNLQIRELKLHHVQAALRRIDAGEGSHFAESTTYDLLVGNKRYPPKRVVGLALEELTGRPYLPGEFIGGDKSVSFRQLNDLGFRIVDKTGRAVGVAAVKGSRRSVKAIELRLRASIKVEQSVAEQSGAFDASDETDARRKVLAAIVRRQGQAQFRRILLKAYNGKCAVTGCEVVDVLEAAHIRAYLGPNTNRVQNGLLLRGDVHTLFDLGLLRIDADHLTVALASRVIGRIPDVIEGAPLHLPANKAEWPDVEALRQHGEQSIAF